MTSDATWRRAYDAHTPSQQQRAAALVLVKELFPDHGPEIILGLAYWVVTGQVECDG